MMTPNPQQRTHDHWRHTLEDAVRAAPFGDVRKAKAPPFSVAQASGLLSSAVECTKFSEAQLQRLAADALRELEKRSRHAIEHRLETQATIVSHMLRGDEDAMDASCFPAGTLLPVRVWRTIFERFGPQVVRTSMHAELCTCASMPDSAVLDAGPASFHTLARLAQRSAHWQALLLSAEDERRSHADCVRGDDDGVAAWPDASAWRRLKHLTSSAHRASLAAPALRCELLSIEPRSAGTRRKRAPAATSSADEPAGHWEVRIRLQREPDVVGKEDAEPAPGDDMPFRMIDEPTAACIHRITCAIPFDHRELGVVQRADFLIAKRAGDLIDCVGSCFVVRASRQQPLHAKLRRRL